MTSGVHGGAFGADPPQRVGELAAIEDAVFERVPDSAATYVLQPLVLTATLVLFASLALAPELTFLVVAVVAVPACFLAGTRRHGVPGLSKVL
jgi:hypothetical protein